MAKAHPQPQPSLWPNADTSPDVALAILGDDSGNRYSLHSVMLCGAEFTYAQLVPFGCTDQKAARTVILMQRLAIAC